MSGPVSPELHTTFFRQFSSVPHPGRTVFVGARGTPLLASSWHPSWQALAKESTPQRKNVSLQTCVL